MIKNLYFDDSWDGFPESYKNNFSDNGKRALFDYLESLEDETGETITFDPVALCCEFTEYDDLKAIQENYTDIKTIDELRDFTQVIEFDGGIIMQDY